MKRLLCLCLMLSILMPATADAKAVKLGRGKQATLSMTADGIEMHKKCDAGCTECNSTTGICSKCGDDQYLKKPVLPARPTVPATESSYPAIRAIH